MNDKTKHNTDSKKPVDNGNIADRHNPLPDTRQIGQSRDNDDLFASDYMFTTAEILDFSEGVDSD